MHELAEEIVNSPCMRDLMHELRQVRRHRALTACQVYLGTKPRTYTSRTHRFTPKKPGRSAARCTTASHSLSTSSWTPCSSTVRREASTRAWTHSMATCGSLGHSRATLPSRRCSIYFLCAHELSRAPCHSHIHAELIRYPHVYLCTQVFADATDYARRSTGIPMTIRQFLCAGIQKSARHNMWPDSPSLATI
jgi:hypothetical protein